MEQRSECRPENMLAEHMRQRRAASKNDLHDFTCGKDSSKLCVISVKAAVIIGVRCQVPASFPSVMSYFGKQM